ncbi:P-loop containing nucleoside triphosphate hydrolase protein [Schizophyllum commune H4-8]|uniref:P-loop containing nucleoside triphosphate hydrolase protein n=1 Tax=Schizophyllum commune (strain H4-8 / FGSC 9210) TaxID=578458 RepID=UPI00215E5327|nr:P-loop containing nucleoside triphosphate hydrolase protein [Schizophyllum commune H4-8]KAI5885343.1 P-loop containing nucleoside triphosphate hydrolase protein [Schizophyllum commune H4-8]
MSPQALEDLRSRMQTQLLRGQEPRPFQLRLAQAQEEGQDAICQAATGQGRTVVASAPYVLEKNADRTTLVISPLIALQNEMVRTFQNEHGVTAAALNSSVDEDSQLQMKRIVRGDFRIVLLSPEMLWSQQFFNKVLRNPKFARKIYSVVVDEAHCVSFWGADFRKEYGRIGAIRAFLSRDVPIIAVSATWTRRVRRNVVDTLQLNRSTARPYLWLNAGNDRPNVAYIMRPLHHTLDSYHDLDFVIPPSANKLDDIPKTWIYADNINTGYKIVQHLRKLAPAHLRDSIRSFNAVLTTEYRERALEAFRDGTVRILVCTDAAGMGCNIPDIEYVIQYKLPASSSTLKQRLGRAGRALPAAFGILLVEKSAYDKVIAIRADTDVLASGSPQVPKLSGDDLKEYAGAHGVHRGSESGCTDGLPPSTWRQLPIAEDDTTEGLYHLVQTTDCRRKILKTVFENDRPDDKGTGPCCDICSPWLLDRARPRKESDGGELDVRLGYEKEISREWWNMLDDWREEKARTDPVYGAMGASCLLSKDVIDKIARLKRHTGKLREFVQKVLRSDWPFWDALGQELLEYTLTCASRLDNPTILSTNAAQVPPSSARPAKRAATTQRKPKKAKTQPPPTEISGPERPVSRPPSPLYGENVPSSTNPPSAASPLVRGPSTIPRGREGGRSPLAALKQNASSKASGTAPRTSAKRPPARGAIQPRKRRKTGDQEPAAGAAGPSRQPHLVDHVPLPPSSSLHDRVHPIAQDHGPVHISQPPFAQSWAFGTARPQDRRHIDQSYAHLTHSLCSGPATTSSTPQTPTPISARNGFGAASQFGREAYAQGAAPSYPCTPLPPPRQHLGAAVHTPGIAATHLMAYPRAHHPPTTFLHTPLESRSPHVRPLSVSQASRPPSSIPNTPLSVHPTNHPLIAASSAATPRPLHTPNRVAQIMPKPGSVIQPDSMQLANQCALRELGGQNCFVGKALSPAILCYSISTDGNMQIHKIIRRASVLCLCEG